MNIQTLKFLSLGLVIGVVAAMGVTVMAYSGGSPSTVIEGDCVNCTVAGGSEALGDASSFGGSTSSDWNVGGNLTIDGTSTLTGATTLTGEATVGIVTSGGGAVNATTTDVATYTLVTGDLQTYSYLDFDFTATDAITYTLPATSTMITLLPSIGSTRTWTLHNASTTAVMTIAAGAGTNLLGIDTNVDTIAADGWATIECIQSVYASAANENISCLMAEFVVAD